MERNQRGEGKTPRKRKKLAPCTCGGEKYHFYQNVNDFRIERMKKLMGGSRTTRRVRLALKLHSKTSLYSTFVPIELLIIHLSDLCDFIMDITDDMSLLTN